MPSCINLPFRRLSKSRRQVGYVLLTRAPVAIRILLLKLYAAPRLACVKPVASVHPEPGSNSSLYKFYLIPFAQLTSFRFNLFSLLTVASYSFHSAYPPLKATGERSCTTVCYFFNLSMNSFVLNVLPFRKRMQR